MKLLPVVLLVTFAAAVQAQTPNGNIADVTNFKALRSWGESTLYQIEATTNYANNPYLIRLAGTRYDMGYAYGHLLADEIKENYYSLLYSLLGGKTVENEITIEVLGLALDWQWKNFLSIEVTPQFKMELNGLEYGARDKGCTLCGRYITRAIVLANAPGDLKDFIYVLLREFNSTVAEMLPKQSPKVEPAKGLQCSMFAVWGKRTANGQLFSGRNLDWNKDTGINKYKMVTVNVPKDSAFPSVSISYAALYGTIAGMSSQGLTVHEANLEENEISFSGFPWTLRLRYIMENAKNIDQAKELWEATNNTVGFNHMVASGPDAENYTEGQTVALAMETMYGYTAYFADNDEREADATYPNKANGAHIGFPLKEAVWRTNHGYDPVIREHYEWSQSPSSWSMQRYMFLHDAFVYYDTQSIPIDYQEAVNITSIAGDKGKHAYSCEDNTDGSNVISVAFQPHASTLYTAWESGSGDKWRPGVCSTYIKLDMKNWFSKPGW